MQTKLFFLAGFLAIMTILSCKKDEVIPVVPVDGIWAGQFSVLSGPYNNYYSFDFKADGTLHLLNETETITGVGTWQYHNDNTLVSGTYSFLPPHTGTFSFLATYDNEVQELDGTWGSGTQEYGGGYWYMYRVD